LKHDAEKLDNQNLLFYQCTIYLSIMLNFIKKGTANIIKADAEKQIISLALVSGQGFIFYGRGGHAKSVLTERVKDLICGAKWNIKSMGSGTREDELKGGIDLNALEGLTADGVQTAKRIKYLYEYINTRLFCLFSEIVCYF
jgi:hypothetical protein